MWATTRPHQGAKHNILASHRIIHIKPTNLAVFLYLRVPVLCLASHPAPFFPSKLLVLHQSLSLKPHFDHGFQAQPPKSEKLSDSQNLQLLHSSRRRPHHRRRDLPYCLQEPPGIHFQFNQIQRKISASQEASNANIYTTYPYHITASTNTACTGPS